MLTKVSEADLAWLAADRGLAAAQESGDPVVVETGIVHLGNSSIRFVHRMCDPATGAEYARLGQFGVQLDLDTRRPAMSPPAAVATLMGDPPFGWGPGG